MKEELEKLIAKYNKQWNKYGMGSVIAYSQVVADLEKLKEMEEEQQGKFTIDFINWLHLNQYKYNPKAKLYQKHFINETLFFTIDELFITFKQQEQ
jgi:hypothetical protein